jgi:NAD-dependent SIR2 family protein deacetylase
MTLHCIKCKKQLTDNEISYCRTQLGGHVLCYACQKGYKR